MGLAQEQIDLIETVLYKFEFYDIDHDKIRNKHFYFNGEYYKFNESTYKSVCKIIDYIKGVL